MPKAPKQPARRDFGNPANADAPPVATDSAQGAGGVSRWAWVSVLFCLVLAALIIGMDGVSRHALVERISRTSFSETAPHTLRVAPGTREEWLVLPYYAMDARWWVLHTERLLREGAWRVRGTELDNAPEGREVHWSSLLMWILAGLASFQSLLSGRPAHELVAEAAVFAGPVMMFVFVAGLAALAAVRFGVFSACFFVMCLLTSYPFARTFLTGEADHHGIVAAFAAAGILCVLAGGGLVRKTPASGPAGSPDFPAARRWFVAGGIFGAASLWVSAATAIPILAGTAAGGLLAGLAAVRGENKEALCPALWRIWGLAGGLASLGFYLLEYFPGHMGWRLEVNHPLYAAAWFGGAYLLGGALDWAAGARAFPAGLRAVVPAAALLALISPLAAILFLPGTVFWVSDKFLLALHKEYILEFQSLFTISRMAGGGISWLTSYVWPIACVAGAGILGMTRGFGPLARRGLLLATPAVVITQALTVAQVRWASAAFAMWAVFALVMVADLAASPREGARRWVFRALALWGWVAIGIGLLPQVVIRAEEERTCLEAPIPRDIAGNLLLRDVALRLIQSSPDRIPVVLSGPNASTELTYHAGLKTIGTLYWENMPGLKKAARIFSADDESSALEQLKSAGVTHIVVPSWDNFAESYATLLAKAEGRETNKAPFFKAIMEGGECPRWLRPFAYPIPTGSGLDANSVKIFAVLPDQSPFESAYYRGIYFFETGRPAKAREMFAEAVALRPQDERPRRYLREIEAGN